MTVISEVEGVECDERDYCGGWLGVSSDLVVLFSSNGVGTVLAVPVDDPDPYDVGEHSSAWDMNMFDAFTGRVTLWNDDVEVIVLDEDEE